MRKFISTTLVFTLLFSCLAGCRKNTSSDENGSTVKNTLSFSASDSDYGSEIWEEITDAFESENPGITVNITISKNLENILSSQMKTGTYPDVVLLGTGREKALTEKLIKEKALEDISDILKMTVPGESVTVEEKLLDGFANTLITKPYGDDKLYLAPMFCNPYGLFYNKALFEEKGWSVPETWSEMWDLGEKAKAERISLFTYPTGEHFSTMFYTLLASAGNEIFYNSALTHREGIWDSDEAAKVFDIIGKSVEYTHTNTNTEKSLKNHQLIIENKVLFIPNGLREIKEMNNIENFEWGFTAFPAIEDSGDRYAYTLFEQIWIPKNSENKDIAKKFIAFMYSDRAAEIFADEGDAVQPIKGVTKFLDDDEKQLYEIYNNGIKVATGAFSYTEDIDKTTVYNEIFSPIDCIISGEKTIDNWRSGIKKISDKIREIM